MVGRFFRLFLNLSLLVTSSVAAAALSSEGLSEDMRSQLIEAFPLIESGSTSPTLADSAIRFIMNSEQYENVAVYRTETGLHIVGQPIRTITSISFQGQRALRRGEIESVTGLSIGGRFDRNRTLEAADRVRELYGTQGYFNAVIQVDFKIPKLNEIQINFKITENKPCLIEQIVFETKNQQLRDRLSERTDRFLRKTFTERNTGQIQERVNEYLRTERYLKSDLLQSRVTYNDDRTKATLFYEVTEPFRYQILIDGNQHLVASDLLRVLGLDDLEQPMLEPANEITQKLRSKYLSLGYANIQITVDERESQDTFTRRLQFTINEGERVKIETIEVTGRISRPSKFYADFIKRNSTDLISSGYYQREGLDLGYKNLITYLKNEGYLRAKMQSSRIEYIGEKRDRIIALITLDEGPLTQVRKIDFNNAQAFTALELMEVTGLQPNTPLRLNDLEGALVKLRSHYRAHGYLEMKITNDDESVAQYNETGSQANLKFDIYEGPKVVVAAIALEGNTFTRDYVILREIDFSLGDVLTGERIDNSILRLNRLGIFSGAEIRTVESGTGVSERTVVIAITERNPGIFRVGAGVHNDRRLLVRGYTSASYNNLYGTARAVTGRLELRDNPQLKEDERFEYRFNAGYLEPFLLNTRTRGRANLTVFQELGLIGQSIQQEGLQVDFMLERDLTNATKLTYTLWSLNAQDVRRLDGGTINAPASQKVALIGPTLTVDYRDNPFLPTTGSFSRMSLDYSDPVFGSSDPVNFFRTDLSHTRYFPLFSSKLVWANQIRGGYVRNVSSVPGSGVPANYAFFLGGMTTVRGYGGGSRGEYFPRYAALENTESGTAIVVPDDSSFYLIKSELRFPIAGDAGGVLFYDAGEVNVTGFNFTQPYRQSVGVGLRYNTPVGPISVDVGFKIRPTRDAEPYWVHLAIGTF